LNFQAHVDYGSRISAVPIGHNKEEFAAIKTLMGARVKLEKINEYLKIPLLLRRVILFLHFLRIPQSSILTKIGGYY
jgi:hypothetical protein